MRPKLSCRSWEAITRASGPSLPIRRGRAGPALIAHVLVAKYADHLPLHRQAEIYAREDIDLPRSTLADMVGQAARLVRRLIDALARHVMAGVRVHADDTVVPVLEPGLGRTRTARLWTYVRDDRPFGCTDPPAVLYRYTPDRKGEHPRAHLAEFKGILQADGYAGFAELYGNRVVEAACMAHARRKFWDVHEKTKSSLSREALERIAALYEIEDRIRRLDPEQRLRVRAKHTAPLMTALHGWSKPLAWSMRAATPGGLGRLGGIQSAAASSLPAASEPISARSSSMSPSVSSSCSTLGRSFSDDVPNDRRSSLDSRGGNRGLYF